MDVYCEATNMLVIASPDRARANSVRSRARQALGEKKKKVTSRGTLREADALDDGASAENMHLADRTSNLRQGTPPQPLRITRGSFVPFDDTLQERCVQDMFHVAMLTPWLPRGHLRHNSASAVCEELAGKVFDEARFEKKYETHDTANHAACYWAHCLRDAAPYEVKLPDEQADPIHELCGPVGLTHLCILSQCREDVSLVIDHVIFSALWYWLTANNRWVDIRNCRPHASCDFGFILLRHHEWHVPKRTDVEKQKLLDDMKADWSLDASFRHHATAMHFSDFARLAVYVIVEKEWPRRAADRFPISSEVLRGKHSRNIEHDLNNKLKSKGNYVANRRVTTCCLDIDENINALALKFKVRSREIDSPSVLDCQASAIDGSRLATPVVVSRSNVTKWLAPSLCAHHRLTPDRHPFANTLSFVDPAGLAAYEASPVSIWNTSKKAGIKANMTPTQVQAVCMVIWNISFFSPVQTAKRLYSRFATMIRNAISRPRDRYTPIGIRGPSAVLLLAAISSSVDMYTRANASKGVVLRTFLQDFDTAISPFELKRRGAFHWRLIGITKSVISYGMFSLQWHHGVKPGHYEEALKLLQRGHKMFRVRSDELSVCDYFVDVSQWNVFTVSVWVLETKQVVERMLAATTTEAGTRFDSSKDAIRRMYTLLRQHSGRVFRAATDALQEDDNDTPMYRRVVDHIVSRHLAPQIAVFWPLYGAKEGRAWIDRTVLITRVYVLFALVFDHWPDRVLPQPLDGILFNVDSRMRSLSPAKCLRGTQVYLHEFIRDILRPKWREWCHRVGATLCTALPP